MSTSTKTNTMPQLDSEDDLLDVPERSTPFLQLEQFSLFDESPSRDLSPLPLVASNTPSTPSESETVRSSPSPRYANVPSVPSKLFEIKYALRISNLPPRCNAHELIGFIHLQSQPLNLPTPRGVQLSHPNVYYCPERDARIMYETRNDILDALVGLTKWCGDYHGRKLKFRFSIDPFEKDPKPLPWSDQHPGVVRGDPEEDGTDGMTTDDDRSSESEVEVVDGTVRSSGAKRRRVLRGRWQRDARKRSRVESNDEEECVKVGSGRTSKPGQKRTRS